MEPHATGQDLFVMANEIERDLQLCEKVPRKIGSVSIKVQSFANSVRRMADEGAEAKKLRLRAQYFQRRVRELGEVLAHEQRGVEEEMEESRIKVQRITEAYDEDYAIKEREFYSKNSDKLDSFIMNAMDSLESFKRQNIYLERIGYRLKQGAIRMGMSEELIGKIETLCSREKTVFFILFGVVMVFIIFLIFKR